MTRVEGDAQETLVLGDCRVLMRDPLSLRADLQDGRVYPFDRKSVAALSARMAAGDRFEDARRAVEGLLREHRRMANMKGGYWAAGLDPSAVRRTRTLRIAPQHMTDEGWLDLAVVLDLFARRIVGWAMADHLKAELVVEALNMAVVRRRPGKGLIHHSDHGAQYTSLVFGKTLRKAGIAGSMGRVGDALDNAAMESFWATLQAELLDRKRWRTRQELKTAVFEYMEVFYNRQRRHSALGYLTPEEFERRWRAQHREQPSTSGSIAAL